MMEGGRDGPTRREVAGVANAARRTAARAGCTVVGASRCERRDLRRVDVGGEELGIASE